MPSAPHRPPRQRKDDKLVVLTKATENKGQEERQAVSLPSTAGVLRRKPIDFAAVIARATKPPVELAALVDALGADGALTLIETRGGTRMYVPHKPAMGSPIVGIVGLEPAQRLAELFGGEYRDVPIARAWRCCMFRVNGRQHAAIASRLGVSERTVRRILTDAGLTGAVWRHIQRTKDAAHPPAPASLEKEASQ